MAPEAAVRERLRQEIRAKRCVSETVDEFWVPRTNERADLAAIGSCLWGFEIKTSRDNLRRLPRQIEAYSRLFDMCMIVVAERHLAPALAIAPSWWGAIVILGDQAPFSLSVVERAQPNPSVDPETLVRLLWREEARAVLSSLGIHPDAGASRVAMWRQVLAVCDLDNLKTFVRTALLAREPYQSDFSARHLDGAKVNLLADR